MHLIPFTRDDESGCHWPWDHGVSSRPSWLAAYECGEFVEEYEEEVDRKEKRREAHNAVEARIERTSIGIDQVDQTAQTKEGKHNNTPLHHEGGACVYVCVCLSLSISLSPAVYPGEELFSLDIGTLVGWRAIQQVDGEDRRPLFYPSSRPLFPQEHLHTYVHYIHTY